MTDPDPEDAASYQYGEAHPLVGAAVHASPRGIARVRVLALGAVGEAIASIDTGGPLVTVIDEGLTTEAQAEDRAVAMLRRNTLNADLATIEMTPHPGQEPGDIVAVTHAPLGLDGAMYRVRSVGIDFSRRPRGRYLMPLELGAP